MRTLTLFAPAKVNRFLHITGRRSDGYHELQTIFHLIDYCDTLNFSLRQDHNISVVVRSDKTAFDKQISNLSTAKTNLVSRAAQLLQRSNAQRLGIHIELIKKIPVGGGLGGGSSDAAATLLALNKLWKLNLSLPELERLGQQLGADVPFFVRGYSAWAEGVGERLTVLNLPETWFLVLAPAINVLTVEVFCNEQLTDYTPSCKIADSLLESGHNDCESVVRRLYPEVGKALDWLEQFTTARMTGTGGCVFAVFANEQEARRIAQQVPSQWNYFVARGLNRSPVQQALEELAD